VVCYYANPHVFLDNDAGNRLRRAAARRTARRAEHVLTPTAGMADLAAPALGRQPEVLPHGIDHERFTPGSDPGTDVLMVADLYPHKRHELAIEAWKRLPAPRPRLRLIGNGRVAPAHAARVAQLIRTASDHGEIVMESGLSHDQLVAAYRGAAVFVCPSLRESFCLPLLEALACGVPAIVADLASLRETGGRAAEFVHSDDPGVWATAIERALVDDNVRARAATAGPEHAAHFSWDRTAATLAGLLAK
jgi:glycosyltransferase involved in cell wall biosynthesis